jgi:hypothetical protein
MPAKAPLKVPERAGLEVRPKRKGTTMTRVALEMKLVRLKVGGFS